MSPQDLTKQVPFGRIEKRIVEALVRHFGEYVPSETLVAAAYASDPNGGPLSAMSVVKQHVYYIRKKLKPAGYKIESHYMAGRRLTYDGVTEQYKG